MASKQDSKVVPPARRKPPNAGKGRVKGVPNKTTALLKDAILMAASNAGGGKDGLVNYLTVQATENPGPFMSLLGKVLPMQVTGADDGPVQIIINRFTDGDGNTSK